ncbi:hypothetical protein D3C80_1645610 [compost metagenome]
MFTGDASNPDRCFPPQRLYIATPLTGDYQICTFDFFGKADQFSYHFDTWSKTCSKKRFRGKTHASGGTDTRNISDILLEDRGAAVRKARQSVIQHFDLFDACAFLTTESV